MFLLSNYQNEKKLIAEITPLLYKNFPMGFLASLIASSVVFWDFPAFANIKTDSIWLLIFLCVYFFRWFLFFWYKASKSNITLQIYHYTLFIFGSSLSGCLWALLGSLFMPHNLAGQTLTLFAISAIIGGGTHILNASFIAIFLFTTIITTPIAIYLYIQATQTGQLVYVLILIYMCIYSIYIIIGSYISNKLLLKTITLDYEKDKILEDLLHSENQLQESEQQYRQIVEFSPFGILVVSKNIIQFVNQAMMTMLKANNETQLLGKNFFDIVHPAYRSIKRIRMDNLENNENPNDILSEKFITLDGKIIEVNTRSARIPYNGNFAIQIFIENISEMVYSIKRITYLSTHDPLTGLVNRNRFEEIIGKLINLTERTHNVLGIIYINLDKMKNINDIHGLEMGDLLLQQISKKILTNTRKSDTVARISGDEFAIAIQVEKRTEISEFANKIKQIISEPHLIANISLFSTACIGISIFPDDAKNSDQLLKHAFVAMHAAKKERINNIHFYTGGLTTEIIEKGALESDLHKAILENNFFLVYQPKISLETKRIVGLEALVRWQHTSGDIILPVNFIPAAEELGLIIQLTKLIVNNLFEQMNKWKSNNFLLYKTSVNLTAYDLRDIDFIDFFINAIAEHKIDTRFLEIEITESALIENLEQSSSILRKLKSLGITISIDDFGTGYSSLSYLNYLQIDYIKIDKSFINNTIVDSNSDIIVKAIIAMAHQLKIKVIAEGVETENQYLFLRDHGCDQVQGFYISKPLSTHDLEDFIRKY